MLICTNSETVDLVDSVDSMFVFIESQIPKTAGLAGLEGLLGILLQKGEDFAGFRELNDYAENGGKEIFTEIHCVF